MLILGCNVFAALVHVPANGPHVQLLYHAFVAVTRAGNNNNNVLHIGIQYICIYLC